MAGHFNPECFHMYINTHSQIENFWVNDNVQDGYISTFIHEYVHYLQCLTTTTGIQQFSYQADKIKAYDHLRKKSHKKFPEWVDTQNQFNNETNEQIRRAVYGSKHSNYNNPTLLSYYSRTENFIDVEQNNIPIIKYFITIQDDLRQEDIHIGLYHIKEYMAYKLQSTIFPNTDLPEIPYNVIEQLVHLLLPELNNDRLIINLCDICLMTNNPIHYFISTIIGMKDTPIPESFDTLKVLFEQIHSMSYNDLVDHFTYYANMCLTNFNMFFHSDYFRPTKTWFNIIVRAAINWRVRGLSIYDDFVDLPNTLTPKFKLLIKLFGTPFITNSDAEGDGFFAPPTVYTLCNIDVDQIKPFYPLAISAINRNINQERGCSLINFCTRSGIMESECTDNPWILATNEKICPYGHVLQDNNLL